MLWTVSSCCPFSGRVSSHVRIDIATASLIATRSSMMRISVRPMIISTVMVTMGSWVTCSVNRWACRIFIWLIGSAWSFCCLIWGSRYMTVASSPARANFCRMIIATTRTSRCMRQLSCCSFNLMNVLLQGVSYLGRMLFALTSIPVCARISSVTNMAARLVHRCLAMKTRFRRSLWRTLSMHVCILMIRSCTATLIVLIWVTSRGSRLITMLRTALVVATVVQMLMVGGDFSAGASLASPILVAEGAVLWCGIWVSRSVSFGTTDWGRGLRRASFNLVCCQFFQVSDAGLESLNALTFTDVSARTLMMMRIYSAIAGCSIWGTCRVAKIRVRVVSCGCSRAWREIGRLVVLAVVHFHC